MDAVADIKARIDVVDLVAEYVPLKPAGAGSFKGLCPFHQERSPSFHVSRTRQSWHCFGCDSGGDIFTFIERIEGMDFRDVLSFLAQKAGVVLPEHEAQEQGKGKKKRLNEVNEMAARFFRAYLLNGEGAEIARSYVAKRQIDDLSADLFLIGYAPDSWSALTDALTKKGVTADELVLAGLASKREQSEGVYDRFRGRLMFPIADVHGNIVGFTGRILVEDKTQAKYVNTPETPLYRKSAVLYGLDKAKAEIRKSGLAVIVEGNMDVVSSHQAGITNVVAASGTALTIEQLTLIKRFTTNLAIAFDQDAAGAQATIRGLDLARQQEFSIKIITLPPEAGKDPDEACKKDPNLWKNAIANAMSIMDWVYQRAFSRHTSNSPEDKRLIADEVLPEMAKIPHPVEREAWVKRLAGDLQVGEEVLLQSLRKNTFSVAPSAPKPKELPAGVVIDVEVIRIKRLFAASFTSKVLFERFFVQDDMFSEIKTEPTLTALYVSLRAAYNHEDFTSQASAPWSQTLSRLSSVLGSEEMKTYDALAHLAEDEYLSQSSVDIEKDHGDLFRLVKLATLDSKKGLLKDRYERATAAGDAALADTILADIQRVNEQVLGLKKKS